MSLVDIEYHKPCTHYDDGYHRKRSGWYTCECGASSAWHTTTPVEPDYEAGRLEWRTWFPCVCGAAYTDRGLISPHCNHHDDDGADRMVNAALGIGGDDDRS